MKIKDIKLEPFKNKNDAECYIKNMCNDEWHLMSAPSITTHIDGEFVLLVTIVRYEYEPKPEVKEDEEELKTPGWDIEDFFKIAPSSSKSELHLRPFKLEPEVKERKVADVLCRAFPCLEMIKHNELSLQKEGWETLEIHNRYPDYYELKMVKYED